jgi:hypothetical protein
MFNKPNEDYLRLTIDSNIIARRYNLNILEEGGHPLLQPHQYLLEAKIIRQLPLWFADALNQLQIYRASVSKYGLEYKKYLQAQIQVKEIQKVAKAEFDLDLEKLPLTDD